MCGRFALTDTDTAKLTGAFSLGETPDLSPRYNIAPTQLVATVIHDADQGFNRLRRMRWGLVPAWAKDTSFGSKLINARGETVHEKPSFRRAFKQRRCLVIADGFYEWHKQDGGKQPMFIHLPDRAPFGMAGLYEHWTDPASGDILTTCTIITTESNSTLRPLHHRMPVILPREQYPAWLDPRQTDTDALRALLRPYPGGDLSYYPVSKRVNYPANDDPTLVERAS